jgi:hypothetical protein
VKLRIRGNSLRLRLQQSEVAELKGAGVISDRICFGPADGQILEYAIEARRQIASISVEYDQNRIVVSVPAQVVSEWALVDVRDGISAMVETGEGPESNLFVAIEKDFACLHDRAGEDDSDAFPNPKADCAPIAATDIERK